MMNKWFIDKEAFYYKLAADGLDLSCKFNGEVIGSAGKRYAYKHCLIEAPDFNVEAFIGDCVRSRQRVGIQPRDLPVSVCDRYEVGYFVTSFDNCFDSQYVLFNKEQLTFWHQAETSLWGLEFMVAPSRGWDGQINEIGFRILNPDKVHNAFKWLFPFGQQATFGLHLCDRNERLLLCEGFQDMIAFRESGQKNVVGLGSADVTDKHKQQLQTDNYVFCGDMDSFGMQQREDLTKTAFYRPSGKDPYEVFCKHGHVELVEIGA